MGRRVSGAMISVSFPLRVKFSRSSFQTSPYTSDAPPDFICRRPIQWCMREHFSYETDKSRRIPFGEEYMDDAEDDDVVDKLGIFPQHIVERPVSNAEVSLILWERIRLTS